MELENCGVAVLGSDDGFCGSNGSVKEGRKRYDLAEELGLTQEDMECAHYREVFCELRKKGLIGLAVGLVIGCYAVSDLADNTDFLAWIVFPALFGLYFAGFPYGWSLITKITGGLAVYGSVIVMLFFYGFKFMFASMLGWAVFPVALLYNYMRSHKKGSKARTVSTAVMMIVFVVPAIFSAITTVIGMIFGG